MGAERKTGRGAATAGTASARARQVEVGRGLCGRNLREREKRGLGVGPTRRGKGTKIVAIAAANSLPLAISVQSASPAECQLVEEVLAGSFLGELPARLIGDKAYDSDPLDDQLQSEYGIEWIAPNRRGRKRVTQDRPNCAATADAGRWNGSLPGCITFAASSPDGNTTSKTSSASCTWLVST